MPCCQSIYSMCESGPGELGVAGAGAPGGGSSAPKRAGSPPHVFSPSAASLVSLVIIFLSFCCLFFAESWIICVYALLLDDSCAVGLQSVFQIRWIMNKPLQQKSHVLYEPCLSSSVPAWLACQPPGGGAGGQESLSDAESFLSVCTECMTTVLFHIFSSSKNPSRSVPVSGRINQCFFSEAGR